MTTYDWITIQSYNSWRILSVHHENYETVKIKSDHWIQLDTQQNLKALDQDQMSTIT